MNKPASELIALADECDDCAKYNTPVSPFDLLREASKALRAAATQSGSERAGVDALREALQLVVDVSKSGADTIGFLIELQRVATVCAKALATPPAQPAPAATHGKPDGAVREAVCCSAISPCEYQRTHRTGVCETCQKAAAIDRLDVKAEAKSQEPDAVAIKPLEWVHVPSGRATSERYDAITLAGVYSVYLRDNGDVQWAINHSAPVNFVDGLSCAKAAAQEDYEHRIRAALIHPTKAPAVSVDAIKAAVTKELSHPEDDAIASRIATTIAALIARGR